MKTVSCPLCRAKMVKNGFTKVGRQRWRCLSCGGSQTVRYDTTAERLEEFLSWLFSKETQIEMPGRGRNFRRRTSEFWRIWPMPEATGKAHRVVYVDGIYLARDLVVLIAFSGEHILSWYMAQSETARAWEALLASIPASQVVVTNGGSGFQKALRKVWSETRVLCCVFHAFCQVRRYTTSRPRLQAGVELYGLAKELLHLENLSQAEWWFERYMQWCEFWSDFLEERGWQDGKYSYTHVRLRKARSSLSRLVGQKTLFTYLDPELTRKGLCLLPTTASREK